MKYPLSTAVVLTLTIAATPLVMAQDNNVEILNQIEALQVQIDALKNEVRAANARAEAANETAEIANETAEVAIESVEESMQSQSGLAGVSIGGYGELHYNNLDNGKKIDFHRFVLMVGKEFNDNLRFFSEFELEHSIAGEGKAGEIELEQAYIEYDFNDHASSKAGVFLLPVGIMNETHEPPTFFGVERNSVEKEIIPGTWWEAGAMFSGRSDSGFSYDLAAHSGLKVPTTGSNAFRIRSGRQKVAKASAEDLAFTGRIRYTGIAGLELGFTAQHQEDITQGILPASATMLETHLAYETGPFGLKALYAQWDIDSADAALLGKDSQTGFYLEPSYSISDTWKVFARYGEYNTAENLLGSQAIKQTDFGVNWYLHEDVVIKADFQNQSGAGNNDGFNLGIGYQF